MRAQVVLLRGERILLARHDRRGAHYWVLPGGEIEPEETPEEAAVREVQEETGLDIRLERLLFVDGPKQCDGVVVKSPRYTFLGRIVRGEVQAPPVELGGCEEKGYLSCCQWMPFEAPDYDAATRDTLRLVAEALAGS